MERQQDYNHDNKRQKQNLQSMFHPFMKTCVFYDSNKEIIEYEYKTQQRHVSNNKPSDKFQL